MSIYNNRSIHMLFKQKKINANFACCALWVLLKTHKSYNIYEQKHQITFLVMIWDSFLYFSMR